MSQVWGKVQIACIYSLLIKKRAEVTGAALLVGHRLGL